MNKRFDELKSTEIVELIDSIFRNVASLFPSSFSKKENWGYHIEEDYCWVKTDPPSEYPNWISDFRFTSANADERVRELLGKMESGLLPPICALGPLCTPSDLGLKLQAAGLSKIASFPGMVFDLQKMDENAVDSSALRLPTKTSSLEVRRIESEAEFSEWVRVNVEGFHEHFHGTGCEESVYRNLLLSDKTDPEVRFYGAFLDDELVGAAQAVFYSSHPVCRFIELHQCSVIPRCRQMGIARRLVNLPLSEAKQQAYILASIFAEAKAADPYWTSMGFVKYCDLDWYMNI